MKIILLRDIPKIGKKYDIKDVADGYARNFLLPGRLAEVATKAGEERLGKESSMRVVKEEIKDQLLAKTIEQLEGKTIAIKTRANEQGHLFAGIDRNALARAIETQISFEIPASLIELEKPLKKIGEYKLVASYSGTRAVFSVVVVENGV